MTHAARALQSHDLSGEGIKLWITDILFDHTRTWRASPDEWSAQCRGHLWDGTNMKDNTHKAHTVISTRRIWNDDYDGQIIFADLGGLKFPDICLTGEENPEKTSPRKPVPIGDRTRAHCVTSAHATTWTARFETVLYVNCKQWRIHWVNQCNMPSDSHNILQIHHRLFTSMNKLCLDRYPSDRYPYL